MASYRREVTLREPSLTPWQVDCRRTDRNQPIFAVPPSFEVKEAKEVKEAPDVKEVKEVNGVKEVKEVKEAKDDGERGAPDTSLPWDGMGEEEEGGAAPLNCELYLPALNQRSHDRIRIKLMRFCSAYRSLANDSYDVPYALARPRLCPG